MSRRAGPIRYSESRLNSSIVSFQRASARFLFGEEFVKLLSNPGARGHIKLADLLDESRFVDGLKLIKYDEPRLVQELDGYSCRV